MVFFSPFSFIAEIFQQTRGTIDTQDMSDAFVETVERRIFKTEMPRLKTFESLDKASKDQSSIKFS